MIIAYTDGSCRKHTTRRGGWAVHIGGGEEYVGTEEETTNQRMELLAACVALERTDGNVEIRSDSKYVVNCMNDSWWAKWFDPDTGAWRRSSVKNQDLWDRLFAQSIRRPERTVVFTGIAGHAGEELNERVNSLAQQASAGLAGG
jgi:ribonuclease HI